MVLTYLAKKLAHIPNCFNNDISFGGRIRKRYLTTFIPPSTKTPIFEYGGNDDQRSFLSLISQDHYDDENQEGNGSSSNDDVNSFQSLPADMDDIESDPELQTLLNRERTSASPSDTDEEDDEMETNSQNNPRLYYPPSLTSNNGHNKVAKDGKRPEPVRSGVSAEDILKLSRRNSKSSIPARKSIDPSNPRRQSYGSINSKTSNKRRASTGLQRLLGEEDEEEGEEDEEEEEEEDFAHEKVTVESEIRIFVKNAIPLMITFCLSQSYTIICTITASKVFGKDELSAVSLGSMTTTITFSIFEGISTGLDVLCPQAYGSGNLKKVGLYTQRSIVFSLCLFIPFALLWWNSHLFFRYVLETEELVRLTTSFLRILILAAPAYIIFENCKRFLQCQGIFNASTMVLFISTPISIVTIKVLAHTMGFIGIAITCVINFWIMCILLLCYILFIDGLDCWNGFSKDAFKGWRELVKFGFAGIVCTFMEDLSWEILTLFSTFFGTSALAAQSAISTVASLTFFIPFAVGIASSTRVANFIGAKRIDGPAQIAARIGLASALIVGLFNFSLLFFGRSIIANMYSNDPEVISLIKKVLPLVAFIQIFDALNTISGSLLRGQGAPYIGGIINFVVYDFFAIPMAIVLAYHFNLELLGLWVGIGLGLFVIGVTEAYYVLNCDWEDAVQKCIERNRIKV